MRQTQVRRLSARDLAAVLAVERQAYPAEMQEPAELIEERLRFEDEHYSSLNLGLFDEERLVGYFLAHLDDGSEFPDLSLGDNVYVADVAVLPAYRRQLLKLIVAFTRELRFEYPGLPVVAHAVDSTEAMWRRHDAVFRRCGYRMSQHTGSRTMRAGHPVSLVVWRPDESVQAAADAGRTDMFRNRVEVTTSSGLRLATCVIGDEDGLGQLRDHWQTLERAIPGLPVFQTHAYQAAWVRSFGLERKLMVVCVLDGDRLIGIAPFQVTSVRMHGTVLRQLSFLGAPWEVDRPRFLFARDERDCAEAVARTLLSRRDQWDVVWFHEQDASDPALDAFCGTLAARGVLHGRAPSSHCPYLAIEGTWQQFLATKSQKFRKNLKAARRKLEAEGRLEYESVRGDAPRLQDLLGEYELLESRSWKAKDAVGVSQSVEHLRFYRHLSHAFGDSGHFVFRCLRLDGRLVAATFGIRHGRTFHSLHIAHDATYDRCSPGTLLEALELEECFGTDLLEYDPLGGFLKNKVRWITRMRDTVEVHLYQRQPRLVAAHLFYFRIKPPLKRILARLGVRWPGKPRTDRVEVFA